MANISGGSTIGSAESGDGAAGADVLIVSYPKSGRTWVRALLGEYLTRQYSIDDIDLMETSALTGRAGLPVVQFIHDGSEMIRRAHPSELTPDKSQYATQEVVFLSRDIRDTLVSAFFQATRRIRVFEGTISDFIRSDAFGIRKIIQFYQHWAAAQHVPKAFTLIRYEDFKRTPEESLTQLLHRLHVNPIDPLLVRCAVEECSLTRMKAREAEGAYQSKRLSAANLADPDSFKVRRGVVGGFRDELSIEDCRFIQDALQSACLPPYALASEESAHAEPGACRGPRKEGLS